MHELQAIYGANTIDPPASHVVTAILAALYALLLVGFLWGLVRARSRVRSAEGARSGELRKGPAQLLGTIAGSERLLDAPGRRKSEATVPAFTLHTHRGPVRVAEARVVFDAGRFGDRPLRGGESVEVAGELQREKLATTDGYRGEATEGWVLRAPEGERVRMWRFSRSAGPRADARSAFTGVLAVGLFAVFSAISLTGYLARLALGQTASVTLVALGEPTRDGVEATIDLVHDDLVTETLPADEAEALELGPIAYRQVARAPVFGAVGPGVALPGSALFFALLFLVCALASAVAITATRLEGS